MTPKMHPMQVDDTGKSSGSAKRLKADWNEKNTTIFVKICVEEVYAGNRPHTHFNKVGWANLKSKFLKATGLPYEYKQFKNKWETLKKEWGLWIKLIEKETGIGWDLVKKTVKADDVWWEAKIQANPDVEKFREEGPKYLNEMEILFKDIVATDCRVWAPSQDQLEVEEDYRNEEGDRNEGENMNVPVEQDVEIEYLGDEEIAQERSDEGGLDSLNIEQGPSRGQKGKRKRSGKSEKRSGAAELSAQLTRMIDSFEAQNAIEVSRKKK